MDLNLFLFFNDRKWITHIMTRKCAKNYQQTIVFKLCTRLTQKLNLAFENS